MFITVFDGEKFTQVTMNELIDAAAKPSQSGSLWIDLKLEAKDEPDALSLLRVLGIKGQQVLTILEERSQLGFRLTPEDSHGVVWVDDNDGEGVHRVLFHWNNKRFITLRFGGDAGIDFVRKRVLERLSTINKTPAHLFADCLELMMVTVQMGLTDLAIRVGQLDQEILQTTRPDPKQGSELTAYRILFQLVAHRFPGYLVNVRAALIDPPRGNHLALDTIEQLEDYAAVVENTQVIIDSVESSIRNTAFDLQTQVTLWQGNQVNTLTAVAAIFLPLTFLTGYFGMNFDWMVGQVNELSHYLVFGVGLMATIAVVAIVLLHRAGYSLSTRNRNIRKVGAERARRRGRDRKKLEGGLELPMNLP